MGKLPTSFNNTVLFNTTHLLSLSFSIQTLPSKFLFTTSPTFTKKVRQKYSPLPLPSFTDKKVSLKVHPWVKLLIQGAILLRLDGAIIPEFAQKVVYLLSSTA